MKKLLSLAMFSFMSFAFAQTGLKGKVVDGNNGAPVEGVTVLIEKSGAKTTTDKKGTFVLLNLIPGEAEILIQKEGYEAQSLPVIITKGTINDLGNMMIYPEETKEEEQGIITLTSDDLTDDETGTQNSSIAGILQSSKDVYQRAVAYNFGQVWFKARGYDSSLGEVLFNGIPMNKISNGRPQWSEWGGLNDVLRNQEFTYGLKPSEQSFGGALGTTNFITRASQMRSGGRISYASTNSNYTRRLMVSYNTGLLPNGWAVSVLGSRRAAQEGYVEGTTYNAWSGFIALEKKLNNKHSLNLTAFYTPNRRGKNSPNTQEVFDLGGLKYNSYWGYQNGEKRNSRMKEINMPTLMLSHYWDIDDKTSLNTNVMFQSGQVSNSRLDYLALNPDPTYYQKLPSYFLRNRGREDYESAFVRTEYFLNDAPESQIMWDELYAANSLYDDAVYLQYKDVNQEDLIALNTVFFKELNDHTVLNASLLYKKSQMDNYAEVMDLLGAKYFTDINKYAPAGRKDNDMFHPNRRVVEGDQFKYHYLIDASIANAYAKADFTYNKVDFYLAANAGLTQYQRDGLYKNGEYQNTSYGKSELVSLSTYGLKAGATYKLSGHHYFDFNAGYFTKAPSIRNTFINARVSNELVPNLTTEKVLAFDASYIYKSQTINTRLTGFYSKLSDFTEVSYYYVQGLTGVTHTDDFLVASLYGIEKTHMGGEFGIEIKLTPTVKLLGAAGIGQYLYANNPKLKISAAEDDEATFTSYLKNYKLSGTPHQGISVGFEYRDPKYWWFSANANFLSHNYVSLSTFRRTDNFYLDSDGVPATGITQEEVDKLLAQERLDDIFLINLVGGKSWKIGDKYLGFFASVNNLLGEKFKTGGFEQSRKGNIINFKEDMEREKPLFGNKYWYGKQTSYYLNIYIRF
jgi:hypothetical protein